MDDLYLLGIRAGEYRYRLIYQYMERVPIRALDLKMPAEKTQHDRMVQLVEAMLAGQQAIAAASETDRACLAGKAAGFDQQIDRLVYDIHGLTQDEVRLVEAGGKS